MIKIVFALFFLNAGAFAHPDISEVGGYNYQRPSLSGFTSPTQSSADYVPGSVPNTATQPSGSYIHQPSAAYVPGSVSNTAIQFSGGYIPQRLAGYAPESASNVANQPSGSYIAPNNPAFFGGQNIFGQVYSSSGSGYSRKPEHYNSQTSQEQKQAFFFAAPDDEEQSRLRIQVAPPTMKNTNIIFVKAPTHKVDPEVIPPPSQSEDRTLVYVLVKKPQQNGPITIPSALGAKQAKPEVFYIKYNNLQDAERAVSESLSGHSQGSNLSDLGNQQMFLKSLEENSRRSGGNDINGSDNGDIFLGSSAPLVSGKIGGPVENRNSAPSSPGGALNARYGPPAESGPY